MPDGHTYVTTPGSALLFPALCVPTGVLASPDEARSDRVGDPTVMMPLRVSTRAQNRRRYINAERHANRQAREGGTAREIRKTANDTDIPTGTVPNPEDDPPPF